MSDEHIATYLNDHLAGATAAVELLEHLKAAHAESGVGQAAAELLVDIEADRQELRELMGRLEVDESRARKASAWLTGKVTELKLRLDDRAGGDLHLFEALEVLSLGIEGKHGLWRALAAAADVLEEDVAQLPEQVVDAHEELGRLEGHVGVDPDHMVGRPRLGARGAGADPDRLDAPRRPPAHGVEHPRVIGAGEDQDDVAGVDRRPQRGHHVRRRQGPDDEPALSLRAPQGKQRVEVVIAAGLDRGFAVGGCRPAEPHRRYAHFIGMVRLVVSPANLPVVQSAAYDSLAAVSSVGRSNYHGMIMTLRKRYSDGLQFDINYTLSKSKVRSITAAVPSTWRAVWPGNIRPCARAS